MKNNATRTIRSEEIAIDVRICAALAANRGSGEVYLAAIAPDMELTVITLDEAPDILPCFDEDDVCLNLPNTSLLLCYNPAQVLKMGGKHYLTGPVILVRTNMDGEVISLTIDEVYLFQKYLASHSITLMADDQKLEQQGYEVKRGKYTSVKGARQKRFIRFRTLGAGYSEEELKAVLAGEAEHRPRQKSLAPEQKFQMLVDIQAKLAEGKGAGFAHWAKQHNLKEMSRTLFFFCRKIKSAASKKCRSMWMPLLLTITNWEIPLKHQRSGWQKSRC